MTREEAIKIIKEIEYPVNGDNKKERDEAIYMAIKALEQQPYEDCISRQAVIDALRDAENHAFNSYYKGLKEAHKIVADLPSAQPNMLDKIRTEIAAITINGQVDGHTMFIRTNEQVKQMALEIIDKYTAESEVRNDC